MRTTIAEYSIVYTMGAMGYGLLETLWRGYTHWSMTIAGGLCFMLIYSINARRKEWGIFKKCIAGAISVTTVEFVIGVIVNIVLGWQVWDYSDMPFSVLGQVCLSFCGLWFLLCIPMMRLSELLQRKLFGYR
ncbi:putative ABC transporter permease [Oscillospiraceae bacterium LTW-04]|nr:hypothetical protein RBH76_03790 [Oscillospiraceae bacterium MB24-C1]